MAMRQCRYIARNARRIFAYSFEFEPWKGESCEIQQQAVS